MQSGLVDRVLASSLTRQDAQELLLHYIQSHCPQPRIALLAGNSIHADRSFLAREFPRVVEHLHYRLIDVSTVKELARRWAPTLFASAPDKKANHRAMDDIRESLAELAHYRQLFIQS